MLAVARIISRETAVPEACLVRQPAFCEVADGVTHIYFLNIAINPMIFFNQDNHILRHEHPVCILNDDPVFTKQPS